MLTVEDESHSHWLTELIMEVLVRVVVEVLDRNIPPPLCAELPCTVEEVMVAVEP